MPRVILLALTAALFAVAGSSPAAPAARDTGAPLVTAASAHAGKSRRASPVSGAIPAGRLVLGRREAPGLRPRPAKPSAAAGALATALGRAGVPRIRAETTQASHFVTGSADLWSLAFVMRTRAAARAQVTAIVRTARGRVPKRVRIGDGGSLLGSAAAGKRPAVVLWRHGVVLGAIVFAAPLRPRDLSGVAVDYARQADVRMAHVLSQTAWERVLGEIGPRGQVSRRTALDLFALAYAPLPGTKRPAGAPARIADGTIAARHILRIWRTLTPAQRKAAGRLLGVTKVTLSSGRTHATRRASRSPAGATAPAIFGDSTFVPNDQLTALAESIAKAYAAKLNYTLKLQIVAGGTKAVPVTKAGAPVAADALPVDEKGHVSDDAPFCLIRLTPVGEKDSLQVKTLTIAHEVFHCYEFEMAGPIAALNDADWIIEGMADWAALEIDPVPYPVGGGSMSAYLLTCRDTPLFERAYSGIGFFGHVQDAGIDLWTRIPTALAMSGNVAQFLEAGGDASHTLDTWAAGVVLGQGLGLAWYALDPIVPPPDVGCSELPIWGDAALTAPAYTLWPYRIDPTVPPDRPLLHVAVDGNARLADGLVDTSDLADAWFCVGESCECPAGTEGTPPPAPRLQLPAHFALTGGTKGAAANLAFVSLDTFCKEKQKPPPAGGGGPGGGPGGGAGEAAPKPVDCAGFGCGLSAADPHLLPFGGLWYDFQAVGEFTLVRSTVDDLEVQVRQQPWPGSKVVAVNTAAAMRVAGDRVAIYKGRPLTVRVDGRPVLLGKKDLRLPHGGTIRPLRRGQVDVLWPDGSVVRVAPTADLMIDLIVSLPRSRSGKVTGLLGNADGNSGNDFVTRRGRRLDSKLISGTGRRSQVTLYRVFGDSWRVTRRSSLFDYAPGQSTTTFTNRRFPAQSVSAATLPPTGRRTAEAACRRMRIKAARVLENCVLDVGSTGHFAFATAAATIERSVRQKGGGRPKPTPPPAPPSSPGAGAGGRWTVISTGRYSNPSIVVPSVALDGGAVVAAYATGDRAIEAATFTARAGGVTGLRKSSIAAAKTTLGNPILLPRAGGGLQALLDGIPPFGISLAPRDPGGSFGPPVLAASNPHATSAGLATLAPDGAALWPASYGGSLWLWKGGTGVDVTSLGGPGSKYTPAVQRDRAGRYWLAWFQLGAKNAPSGLFVVQIDPSGLKPLGAPSKAPGSESVANRDAGRALACAGSCRLVYVREPGDRLVSWSPGSGAPAVVARLPAADALASHPEAAYATGGRLWVAWWSAAKKSVVATLGNTAGTGGAVRALGRPAAASRAPSVLAAVAAGQDLVLLASVPSPGKQAAQYASVVPASG